MKRFHNSYHPYRLKRRIFMVLRLNLLPKLLIRSCWQSGWGHWRLNRLFRCFWNNHLGCLNLGIWWYHHRNISMDIRFILRRCGVSLTFSRHSCRCLIMSFRHHDSFWRFYRWLRLKLQQLRWRTFLRPCRQLKLIWYWWHIRQLRRRWLRLIRCK